MIEHYIIYLESYLEQTSNSVVQNEIPRTNITIHDFISKIIITRRVYILHFPY